MASTSIVECKVVSKRLQCPHVFLKTVHRQILIKSNQILKMRISLFSGMLGQVAWAVKQHPRDTDVLRSKGEEGFTTHHCERL